MLYHILLGHFLRHLGFEFPPLQDTLNSLNSLTKQDSSAVKTPSVDIKEKKKKKACFILSLYKKEKVNFSQQ